MEAAVQRQMQRELAAERREARSNARSRCRARELKELAQEALTSLDEPPPAPSSSERAVVLRSMSALELGLMYCWMEADERLKEAQDASVEGHIITRWWGAGAVGLQQAWEEASCWYDEGLEHEGSSSKGLPAAETLERLTEAVHDGGCAAALTPPRTAERGPSPSVLLAEMLNSHSVSPCRLRKNSTCVFNDGISWSIVR